MNDNEKFLDSQLWHACAGGMVQMPLINSKVFYFPQGHAEHAQSSVDFGNSLRIPPLILCRVNYVKYMADIETDEVYAKIFMTPLRGIELDYCEDDELTLGSNGSESQEKPSSFAKTLTQSDANNGGGFSVPRYCAETIFPRLDYSADPPVQEVLAKDVHGKIWKFRHIYRGTPRRHLLTTGWSNFVNEKKLVAGDSIVFLRNKNGDLCMGIRRANKGFGNGFESPIGWNHPMGKCMYEGLSIFLREEESKFIRGNTCGDSNMRPRGKVKAYTVIEAITLAVNGQPFEVVYYPRASTPEFCVKASAVKAALRIQWCSGMRFKMAFETEDSSRISWFTGTISDSRVSDPTRWPGSPWRLLQVSWDEPDLLQNVRSVSPWLVELISNMPSINLAHLSPPRKKTRSSQLSDFPLDTQLPTSIIPKNLLTPSSSPLCCLPDNTPAAGIQGARHSQYGLSLPELRFFHGLDHFPPPSRISTGLIVSNSGINGGDNSCMLTIGNSQKGNKECKKHQFMLFGKVILTEEELSTINKYSSSGLNSTKMMSDNSSSEALYLNKDKKGNELGLETGHCKVIMESENVGRSLDLSTFGSYEELYRLANMFGIRKSELASRLLYRDPAGGAQTH
ncbi:hypothetical protein IEQ34_008086 [Dendrobium chrysotoxum]|uniref:Auxin response factor n=1 Tax=Dendrobium chrysotoxum TaxID=161865 RepID=A0AAV7H771_DENCH|nr:hypothetical protein IEQ34_008086 [Dendrobium chrysotoxum]